ncbi:MAG: YabP/YqfC family sporulation protein [Clostridia bacterium]|nr:YabP/YqfC family sporulation protein [Clostridia bacterium]
MENKKEPQTLEIEQLIVLSNKKNLSVSGTNKIISLNPDLIQLNTVNGDLQILGDSLELIKLDNTTTRAEISGNINSLKFIQPKNKEPFFRKIFK